MTLSHGSPAIVITGLQFFADAANTGSSATTWVERGPYAYSGTWTGAPTYSPLWVTTTTNYVQFGVLPQFDFGTSDFSINFWINPTQWVNGTNNSVGVIGKKTSDATNGWQIYHNTIASPTKMVVRLTLQNDFASATNVLVGGWQMWTLTRSGTTFSWWYNSVLDSSTTASYNLADNTAGMNICYAQTWGGTYPGSISVVQIYNYALAAGQISQNFNAHRGRFGI